MTPEVLRNAGQTLERYDVLLCDIWGVLHSGGDVHAEAAEALLRFRRRGGTVILVSNAPMAASAVGQLLDAKKLDRAAWDSIVCSGEIALAHIGERGWRRLLRIGPPNRDASFFDRLPGPDAPLDAAEAIACTGLVDDRNETAEDYRALLTRAAARNLPLVCANPDLVVEVRGLMLPCAGTLGALYESLRGEVFWAGKPHPSAYEAALRAAAARRDTPISRAKVLAIGDAVRTDLAAAAGAGVDALFVTSGIHRADVMSGGAIATDRLHRLLAQAGIPARAAIPALCW